MPSKIFTKQNIRVALIAGLIISLTFLFSFIYKNKMGNINSLSTKQEQATSTPLRLKIPRINIDANVENVGLTAQGAMGTPKDIVDVGWFSLGIFPGKIGSAVIDGHYGWKDGIASAFDNLYKLKKGDILSIEDGKGNIISFVVREIKNYNPKADTQDIFSSNDGKSHLNLITCEGDWNKTQKSYSNRLVVFTDRVD